MWFALYARQIRGAKYALRSLQVHESPVAHSYDPSSEPLAEVVHVDDTGVAVVYTKRHQEWNS
jgi:hypothetical protein